jgi:hypothetical protein
VCECACECVCACTRACAYACACGQASYGAMAVPTAPASSYSTWIDSGVKYSILIPMHKATSAIRPTGSGTDAQRVLERVRFRSPESLANINMWGM